MNNIFALQGILPPNSCAARVLKDLLNSRSEGSALAEMSEVVR
jgi:hypothetical protein